MKFPRIVWAGGFSKKAIMTHTQVNSKEQYLRFIRLNNNRMNANVVRDKPGPKPNALSEFLAKLLPTLLNNKTPTTTTPKIV